MLTYGRVQAIVRWPVRLLWRLDVQGLDRLPPGPVVLVANHGSYLDPFVVGAAIPRPFRFLAKEELWRWPLRSTLDRLGGIPVSRGRGDRDALAAAAAALRGGESVALFPQGTVLGPPDRTWHRGAARLGLATGCPLVPVAIVGSDRALPPHSRRPRFPVVRVVVGEPIEVQPGRTTVAAARELTARVRAEVERLAASAQPAPPQAG